MRKVKFILVAVICIVSVSVNTLSAVNYAGEPFALREKADKQSAQKQKELSKKELQAEVAKLERRLEKKDSVLSLQQKKVSRLEQQLKDLRDSLAIYEFFNDNDIGIFSNESLEKGRKLAQLTGKNKINYLTIRKIAEVESMLNEIDTKISLQEKRQTEQGWTDADLKNAIALEIKAEMLKLEEKLNKIDNCDLSFLSEIQKGFYEKQCSRFDVIYNKYML